MNTRRMLRFTGVLLAFALFAGVGCGRYGPPDRAPEYRDDGSRVTEATSAMGRGSERADETRESGETERYGDALEEEE